PLDQVERRVDLVGAVQREVEARLLLERGQRDAERGGARGGVARRRHAGHALQRAVAQPLAEQVEQVSDGRAGPEAEHHAVLDPLERALGRLPLQRFTVAHDAAGVRRASARWESSRPPAGARDAGAYLAPLPRRSSTRRTAAMM